MLTIITTQGQTHKFNLSKVPTSKPWQGQEIKELKVDGVDVPRLQAKFPHLTLAKTSQEVLHWMYSRAHFLAQHI